jgi:Xaa-Pro aminopeptidase
MKRESAMKGQTIHTTEALTSKVQNFIDGTKSRPNDPAPRAASTSSLEGRDGTSPHDSSSSPATSSTSSRVVAGLLESTLARCRAIKTDAEVACLLEANIASGQAHKAIWRACRPGNSLAA